MEEKKGSIFLSSEVEGIGKRKEQQQGEDVDLGQSTVVQAQNARERMGRICG